jgi:glyoxylase-like metal-dependent hydrolase (beta-lactamase superfamily II)
MQDHRTSMIGTIAVTPISDGSLDSSLDKVVEADRSIAAKLIAQHGGSPLKLPVLAFLLNVEGRLALVDAGAGSTMGASMGYLVESLAAKGVSPDAISHVLITHLHRDHFGGLLDAASRPSFSNAELILHEQEADFWLKTAAEDMPERARRFLDLMLRSIAPYRDRIRTVRNGRGLPGIKPLLQPGHTPGHTCWLIESEGKSALLVGDLMHVAAVHLPRPEVRMVYDLDPAAAVESRRRVLDWVASDRIPIAGAHLASPGFSHVVRQGNGYRFDADG